VERRGYFPEDPDEPPEPPEPPEPLELASAFFLSETLDLVVLGLDPEEPADPPDPPDPEDELSTFVFLGLDLGLLLACPEDPDDPDDPEEPLEPSDLRSQLNNFLIILNIPL